MAKPELGTKRICASCGAKFYDLSRDPITCPKCGTTYEIVVPTARGRGAAAAAAAAAVVPAAVPDADVPVEGAEVISLDDADAEATGRKAKVATLDPELETEDDVAVEDDEEDNTFLETDEEEEGGDVSDIIGDGIEKDEET